MVAFLENQRSDYSREMTQARNRLLKKLGQIKDDELQKLRAVLLTGDGIHHQFEISRECGGRASS